MNRILHYLFTNTLHGWNKLSPTYSAAPPSVPFISIYFPSQPVPFVVVAELRFLWLNLKEIINKS